MVVGFWLAGTGPRRSDGILLKFRSTYSVADSWRLLCRGTRQRYIMGVSSPGTEADGHRANTAQRRSGKAPREERERDCTRINNTRPATTATTYYVLDGGRRVGPKHIIIHTEPTTGGWVRRRESGRGRRYAEAADGLFRCRGGAFGPKVSRSHGEWARSGCTTITVRHARSVGGRDVGVLGVLASSSARRLRRSDNGVGRKQRRE